VSDNFLFHVQPNYIIAGQVRVGLAHEGFRTIIYKNSIKKNAFVIWEPPLNIYFILFLVFVVIALDLICENFNCLAIAVLEIQPGDRQTDGQRSLSNRDPFLPFGYGILKTSAFVFFLNSVTYLN
jgi:hypothetical protein